MRKPKVINDVIFLYKKIYYRIVEYSDGKKEFKEKRPRCNAWWLMGYNPKYKSAVKHGRQIV